ncbi:MAG: glycoside hydrolase family 88 protein [Parabacteroides sp.]
MKRLILFFLCCCLLPACRQQQAEEPMAAVVERGLQVAADQALRMAHELEQKPGAFPKTLDEQGQLETSDYRWWCSGFFPGELWYLYETFQTPELKRYAELFTERVEPAKSMTNTHDLGFMLNCSYGNGYRLTHNPAYREVMLEGARSLATRYNEKIGLIRSWDFTNEGKWQYAVIIDNMMNLEFLLWASREAKEERYYDMAVSHANRTLMEHYRPDYSCYHVVSYDTITGYPQCKQTRQGYADESSWSRGQAWGLYGYTMMYRETHINEYFIHATRIANYLMNHPRMPEDKVPYWDFDTPDIPNTPRDASAAAIMASALIELASMDQTDFGRRCLAFAEEQLRSLSSPAYLAEPGSNGNFLLKHSTGFYLGNSEIDVPLTYADYYYVEALLRWKALH